MLSDGPSLLDGLPLVDSEFDSLSLDWLLDSLDPLESDREEPLEELPEMLTEPDMLPEDWLGEPLDD